MYIVTDHHGGHHHALSQHESQRTEYPWKLHILPRKRTKTWRHTMTPCGFPFQSPGHEYFCVLILITRLQIQEACNVGDSGRGAYIPVSAPHTSIRLRLHLGSFRANDYYHHYQITIHNNHQLQKPKKRPWDHHKSYIMKKATQIRFIQSSECIFGHQTCFRITSKFRNQIRSRGIVLYRSLRKGVCTFFVPITKTGLHYLSRLITTSTIKLPISHYSPPTKTPRDTHETIMYLTKCAGGEDDAKPASMRLCWVSFWDSGHVS
jgi:hypothetical protein